MVELAFFGGVNEIGGNKILLEDNGTRILLDFGLSFTLMKEYYDEYLQARSFGIIDEYVAFGLLPNLKGLYREDHLAHVSPRHPLMGSKHRKTAEAVVISHAHMDHVGLVPYLRPDIKLMGSETTHNILTYLQDTMDGDAQEFCHWYPSFQLVPLKRGQGMKRARRNDLEDQKETREYINSSIDRPYQMGDIEIATYPVDHSLPGANAYIAKTGSGNIAYTGDLRFHGYGSDMTKKFLKSLEETDVTVLLCEGTRADEPLGLTEDTLRGDLTQVFDDTRKVVLVNYAARDTSRLLTLSKAAIASGRKLLINPKQAYYLKVLRDGGESILPEEQDVSILLPRRGWGIWGDTSYDEKNRLEDYSYSYPKPIREYMFEQSVLVTPQDVADAQSEYVVTCSFYEINLLHDLKPAEGSCFVWSQSEPFDDESAIDFARVKRWLRHFGLGEPLLKHCSGHMSGTEIREFVERAQPEIVVPIHTEKSELFKEWHADVRLMNYGDMLQV
ncbi:MAG: MBL fold metallo-hydrolase [Candidatus Thorarchaeota archaeon]